MALKIGSKLIQLWTRSRGITRHFQLNGDLATTNKSTDFNRINQLNCTFKNNSSLVKPVNLGSIRCLKTSQQRLILSTIWVAFPTSGLIAVLVGRVIRVCWRYYPPDKRVYLTKQIRRNYHRIILVFSGFLALIWTYYYLHLETTPITNRRRFVAFSPEEYNQKADKSFRAQLELYQSE